MFIATLFKIKNKKGSYHSTHKVEVKIHEGKGVQDSHLVWHFILVYLSHALFLVCMLQLALVVSDLFTLGSTSK